MRPEFDKLGKYGLVRDLSGDQIPPEAWTRVLNVECAEGQVKSSKGWISPWANPSHLIDEIEEVIAPDGTHYFIAVGEDRAYAAGPVGISEISQAGDLVKAPGDGYSIVNFHGWCIINSAGNVPQVWDYLLIHNLVDMPGWNVNVRVKRMYAFKEFLVGIGVSKDGGLTWNDREVIWSNSSDPGSLPIDWSYADPTSDSGIAEPRGSGKLIGATMLRDALILYHEDSVTRMEVISGQLVMRFTLLFNGLGVVGPKAIAPFTNGQEYHLVVTKNDIRIHDGIRHESILNDRFRKEFFGTVNAQFYTRTFALTVPYRNEVRVFYADDTSDWPNLMLVWNYKDNTLVLRQCPVSSCAAIGLIDTFGMKKWDDFTAGWNQDPNSWDSDTQTWQDETQNFDVWQDIELAWNELEQNPNVPRVVAMSARNFQNNADEFQFCLMDLSSRANGIPLRSITEKRDLVHTLVGKQGPYPDVGSMKFVREVWPKIRGTGTVRIYIGSTYQIDGNFVWQGPFLFRPGIDKKIDCYLSGRLFGIRFETISDRTWVLDGYALIVQPTSVY